MKKRALSMIIAIAMVVALVPNLILTAGAADTYQVWVGGEQFTSEKLTVYDGNGGTATYDPDTTTLTLNNYNYSGAGHGFEDADANALEYAAIYYDGTDTLNLNMIGNNRVANNAASYDCRSYGVYSRGPLIFNGDGSLTAEGAGAICNVGINSQTSIDIDSGAVTAIAGDSDFESGSVSYGIRCYPDTVSGRIDINEGCVVTAIAGNASYESYGFFSNYCYIQSSTVTAQGMSGAFYFSKSLTIDYSGGICFYGIDQASAESQGEREISNLKNDSAYRYVRIQRSTAEIPLQVGGEQISYDKLTVSGGNGTAVYDPQTNTLTLNNYTYEGATDAGIRYTDDTKTLNLVLNGSNTVSLNQYRKYSIYGVYAKGGLNISGDGSLNTKVGGAGDHCYGIYAGKDITISGGTITAAGGNIKTVESKTSYGLCSKNGSITISGGKVTATGGDTVYNSYGIYAYQDITVSGGTVTATGGVCYQDSFGIYAKQNVTVSGGTVTATGGYCDDNRLYSVGIYCPKTVTISGGTVTVSGTANTAGYGIYVFTSQRIIISGGTLTASASKQAFRIAPDTSDYVGSCYYGDSQSAAESAGAKPIGDLADNHGKMYVMMKDSRPTVTIANGIKNGTVTADKAVCKEGGTVTLTAVPDAGYLLDSWNVTDAGGAAVSVTESNQFTMPASSVTVSAVFKACDHSGAVYTDNEDGTHSITCAACGVNESEDHSGGTATCSKQAECKHCGASYGIVDKTNHDKTVAYSNGFCEYGCYEPAELVDGYYQIKNAGQLFWFANYINTVDRTASAVLTADIDLENRPWTPIGFTNESSNNFRGVFDGQNHTIKGLYVVGGRAGLGFFGEVRTGTVKNFTIYGEVIVNTEVNYVGGVIGSACGLNGSNHGLEHNGATIQNITSYVNLTAKTHGIGMIGGFVGYANHQSLIENCSWYGTFDAGKYRVDSGAGGFIGKIQENTSEVTIRNCAAYGTIKTNYEKNSFNNTPTIYMGGFLSFSNTKAQTTLENCLFAGKFERGENLTDEAFLGAFGTLQSVKAIKNCYYLGDDGLEAVHSNSPLKPGSGNVEIRSVTGARLKSGEVAYKLGEHFGQILEGENRQSYPVLGGEAVYQVLNCKNETAYSNTNGNIGHVYVGGVCTVCGASKPIDLGDVDCNGEVTNADLLLIYQYIYDPETSSINAEIADVSGDGKVTNADVLRILRYIFNSELYPLN